ncbi:heparan-alpha-glucosaminide N-acetyltransferase [Halobacteriovorax sp. RT-2-4]|uniref:heparan-alpha-glucosaminide N-acetyltransferase n=1 Tax=unclassified Halobacteriovorax TaxID=2639665 RepID=UPI003999D1B0
MTQDSQTVKKRYHLIDLTRGVAVILMIIFHFTYDLDVFGFVDVEFFRPGFWYYLPRLIVTLFMFSVGVSMCMAHPGKIHPRPYLIRLAKIGIAALIISVSTYFMFPKNWIYFGTLHCIFFTTILVTPIRKKPWLSALLALVILVLQMTPYAIPFPEMSHASLDYIAVFPWAAVSMLGITFFHLKWHQIDYPQWKIMRFIQFLGKHSFIIYVTHQLFLYSIVYIAYMIIKSTPLL